MIVPKSGYIGGDPPKTEPKTAKTILNSCHTVDDWSLVGGHDWRKGAVVYPLKLFTAFKNDDWNDDYC